MSLSDELLNVGSLCLEDFPYLLDHHRVRCSSLFFLRGAYAGHGSDLDIGMWLALEKGPLKLSLEGDRRIGQRAQPGRLVWAHSERQAAC